MIVTAKKIASENRCVRKDKQREREEEISTTIRHLKKTDIFSDYIILKGDTNTLANVISGYASFCSDVNKNLIILA